MLPPAPAPLLGDLAPSAAERAAFREAARAATIAWWPRLALGASAVAILWWPTDLILYAGEPLIQAAYVRMRLGVVALCVPLALLGPRVALFRRHPEAVVGLGILACSGWIGLNMGLPEGHVDRLFPFLYPTPLLTIPMLVPLRARAGWATLTGAAAWLSAHPGGAPAAPQSWDQLSFLGFTVVLGVAMGDVLYKLLQHQHLLERRLAAREAELSQLAAGLEERVAEQATLLLDLNGQAATARQRERARIARDLHDGLGQELTGTRLVAGALMAGPLPEEARAGLAELAGLLGRSTQSLRQAVHDLAPAALEEHGLVVAIRGMVEETAARAGLRAVIELDPLTRPPPTPVAVAAFRVAQEALSNVVRHASAREVRVELQVRDGALWLRVSDDGVGLPATPSANRSRFGLLGIQQRVLALGGEVTLEGGQGTTVTVRLPLEHA